MYFHYEEGLKYLSGYQTGHKLRNIESWKWYSAIWFLGWKHSCIPQWLPVLYNQRLPHLVRSATNLSGLAHGKQANQHRLPWQNKIQTYEERKKKRPATHVMYQVTLIKRLVMTGLLFQLYTSEPRPSGHYFGSSKRWTQNDWGMKQCHHGT